MAFKGPSVMYHAATIANAFVRLGVEGGRAFHPRQLTRLVYLAHGWHLAYFGTPLISERVQACRYGPIIRSLYRIMNGRLYRMGSELHSPNPRFLPTNKIDDQAHKLIESVYRNFCRYSGVKLATYVRQGYGDHLSPWSRVWAGAPNENAYLKIPNSAIAEFFTHLKESHDVPSFH